MSAVWRRPSLTALEIVWRWWAGVPILACVLWWGLHHLPALNEALTAVQTVTVFRPFEADTTLRATIDTLWLLAKPSLLWFAPLAMLLWAAAGALGQNIVSRRLTATTHRAAATLFVLRLAKLIGVTASLALWAFIVHAAQASAINTAVAQGREPNVLLFLAIAIIAAIVLFVLWAGLSFPLDLAQTLATQRGLALPHALRAAISNQSLRAQVLELNLVFCIIRIALLVLALVFSACPLPFESVETQTFLFTWWSGVALWYLITSDYFHTVRLAARAVLESAAADPR